MAIALATGSAIVPSPGGLYHDHAFINPCLFRLTIEGLVIRSSSYDVGDPELDRSQVQGHDLRPMAARIACMSGAPQSPPDHDITTGTDMGTWVDVSIDQNIAIAVQMVAGTQCASMNEESVLALNA